MIKILNIQINENIHLSCTVVYTTDASNMPATIEHIGV